MDDERFEERKYEGKTIEEAWDDVGKQFTALGESLATAFRTAWKDEQSRRHLNSMKVGLQSMVDQIGQAIQEGSTTPEGRKAQEEVEKVARSARVAGEKALADARPHLISALTQINAEVERFIKRLEQEEPASEASDVNDDL